MRIVDNTTTLLGDDLKNELAGASKLRVAAACFSIYAFDALKTELGRLKEFEFIFTSPTFIPNGAIDKIKKERREFFIPKDASTGALSGSPFEIQLRNKMTQRAVARECADWIRS
ncbi:MAG: ATP-dependent helicase, partial [Alphaproteobacteria bacterium]